MHVFAGRAGHAGEAVTFFTEADAPRLRGIARVVADAGGDVPDWMLRLAKQRKRRPLKRSDHDQATETE